MDQLHSINQRKVVVSNKGKREQRRSKRPTTSVPLTMRALTETNASRRPPNSDIPEPDIERILTQKPQNFNAAKTKLSPGEKQCNKGCNVIIKEGDQSKHDKNCPNNSEFAASMLSMCEELFEQLRQTNSMNTPSYDAKLGDQLEEEAEKNVQYQHGHGFLKTSRRDIYRGKLLPAGIFFPPMDIDYDSSLEELSAEELRMLASQKRQEPQGEEHVGNITKPLCSQSQTSAATLPVTIDAVSVSAKIKNTGSSVSSSPYSSEAEDINGVELDDRQNLARRRRNLKKHQSQQHYGKTKQGNNNSTDSTNSAYNTLIIHQNNSSLLADTWIPATHEFTSYGIGNRKRDGMEFDDSLQLKAQRSAHSYSNPYENIVVDDSENNNSTFPSSELLEIPRDYLNQLTVLKHLAKEVKQDPVSGTTGTSLLRSASFSKSQPDLTQTGQQYGVGARAQLKVDDGNYSKSQPQQAGNIRKKKKQSDENVPEVAAREASNATVQNPCQASPQRQHSQAQQDDVLPSVQILEILMRENAALNTELVNAKRKIATIHKLETELDRLQAAHEALFASAERRESLERTARAKLNTELKRLNAVNRELLSSGSLQNLSPSPYASSTPDIELLKKEIAKRDYTIAQLLAQNKDLVTAKERQDIELSAQRATLTEQRTHIDILDSALTNAQANVLRLEEECRKKQEFVDKSSQLQRALSSLQLTQDKREQSEKKVRSQLEGEISDLKLRLASLNVTGSSGSQHFGHFNAGSNGSVRHVSQNQRSYQSPPYTPPKYESSSNLTENQLQLLQEKLKASEEQIYHLNSQVAKWENVFTPSGIYKQQQLPRGGGGVSVSTPDTPNSWTNSNSRGGTPHFFSSGNSEKVSIEELQGHGRSTDLEWKVKDLESRLMEKDAMIRILQIVPASSPSPVYSSMLNPANTSSGGGTSLPTGSGIPSYRDSPGYSHASTITMSPCHPLHPTSVSLASMMSDQPSSSLLYSTNGGKCDSEPPSYANLPLKLRLGGSGSSLVKNSNESLQLGGSGSNTGGNSPNMSGPGSISSVSGAKSIDDQLKDLDNQLLSKDGVGGIGIGGGGGPSGNLKIQSGLCCIPGFPHPGSSTRKGKISQSLLESITVGAVVLPSAVSGLQNPGGFSRKTTSVLPPKPPSGSLGQNQDGGQGSRTSSGPPFVSPTDQSPMLCPLVTTTTAMSLSNSVDSILSDPPNISIGQNGQNHSEKNTCNVFAPAVGVPKGLPPKPTVADSLAGKSRSLERNKYVNPGEPLAGKYTSVMYDASRCRSLDRRELKLSMPSSPTVTLKPTEETKTEEKKESKNLKSSVSSKAAFFGQLLTRRSPSPGREKDKKEKQEGSTPKLGRRFPFGSSKSSQQQQPSSQSSSSSSGEVAEERMMLDKQGRQSQRNRISSKWSSCNTLEAVEEQSGSESPWTCRKSKGSPKVSKKVSKEKDHVGTSQGQQRDKELNNKEDGGTESTATAGKKWGRIVKTPFGLRYTFGSPRVAAPVVDHRPSSLSSSSKNNQLP